LKALAEGRKPLPGSFSEQQQTADSENTTETEKSPEDESSSDSKQVLPFSFSFPPFFS
jgi:hypothetical protein